jgi:hypothetical protein
LANSEQEMRGLGTGEEGKSMSKPEAVELGYADIRRLQDKVIWFDNAEYG